MALEIFDWFFAVEPEYTKVSDLLGMEIGESKEFLTLDDENINSACVSHVEDREYPADIFFCNSRLTIKKIGPHEWEIYFWWDDRFEFPTRTLEVHVQTDDYDFWHVVGEAELEHLDWEIGWKGPMIPWEKVIDLPPVYFSEDADFSGDFSEDFD